MMNRKKVGIITFHFVENQGAVLQTFAMQEALKSIGYHPIVINYMPEYHTADYNSFISPFFIYRKNRRRGRTVTNSLLRAIYSQRRNFSITRRYRMRSAFEAFRSQYLNRSNIVKEHAELQSVLDQLDAVIVGSDQIWNKDKTNQCFNPAYFGGDKVGKYRKIAYAASAAGEIACNDKEEFLEQLSKLDFISARESILSCQIQKWTGRDCPTLLDPSLLLMRDIWRSKLIEGKQLKKIEGKYLLVYISRGKRFANIAQDIAKKKGCKIVEVNQKRTIKGAELIYDAAPDQFLNLLEGAECVFVSSFHGTAMSMLFHKDFYTFVPSDLEKKNDFRMQSLMSNYGLADRIITEKFTEKEKIDYETIDEKISKDRSYAIEWIKSALEKGI